MLYRMILHQTRQAYDNILPCTDGEQFRKSNTPTPTHLDFGVSHAHTHTSGGGRRQGARAVSKTNNRKTGETTKAENKQGKHTTSRQNKGKERGKGRGESIRNPALAGRRTRVQNKKRNKAKPTNSKTAKGRNKHIPGGGGARERVGRKDGKSEEKYACVQGHTGRGGEKTRGVKLRHKGGGLRWTWNVHLDSQSSLAPASGSLKHPFRISGKCPAITFIHVER